MQVLCAGCGDGNSTLMSVAMPRATMTRVEEARSAVQAAVRQTPDLVVIDQALKGMPVGAFLTALRDRRIEAPVIVLSTNDTPHARAAYLSLGADDVIGVPFDPEEMGCRAMALLRRCRVRHQDNMQVGNVTLSCHSFTVSVDGRIMPFSRREFELLKLLMRRRGNDVSKDTIMRTLYAEADRMPDARILDVFLSKIRRRLAEHGADPIIMTVHGCGYRVRGPEPCSVTPPAISPVRPVLALTR